MKIIRLVLACSILLLFITSCEDSNPTGVIVENSGCKRTTPSTTSCVEYDYDQELNILYLSHIDAGFNCCVEQISADIQIDQQSVSISAAEVYGPAGPCDCLCLYDVEFVINDLGSGEYLITVEDSATEEPDELLQFTVDLSVTPSGIYCVERNHYPWNMGDLLISKAGKKRIRLTRRAICFTLHG